MRWVFGMLVGITALYGLFLLALWLGQGRLVFMGTWLLRDRDARRSTWAEVVEVQRADGATLPVLLSRGGHDRLVLMAHGNGELAADMGDYAAVLGRAGWDLAVMEYRGYGGVPGDPSEATLRSDLLATIDTLVGRGRTLDRTVLHGRSIGGGVVGSVLDTVRPAGVVLESTFDSLEAVIGDQWFGRVVPVRWINRNPFRTRDRVIAAGLPVFQAHDTTDALIAVAHAKNIPVDERHITVGFPHGAPIVLLDPTVRVDWLAWLDARVPAR